MFCRYCGKQIFDDSVFCCCCGKKVGTLEETPAPVALTEPAVVSKPEPEVVPEPVITPKPVVVSEPVIDPEPEPVPVAVPDPVSVPEPVIGIDKSSDKKDGLITKVSALSILSFVISLLGFICYVLLLAGIAIIPIFVVLTIASLILPLIALKRRYSTGKDGGGFEVAAIVIGGFNFYFIVFALTKLPMLIGFLGWIVIGIIYKKI